MTSSIEPTNHPAAHLMPILAMAPNTWDEDQWMNRQQLLSRIGKAGSRVLYTNGQWSFWQRNGKAWQNASWGGDVELVDNIRLDRPPKWLVRFPRRPILDRLSIGLGSRRLARLTRTGGQTAFLLNVYHPAYQPYARHLPYSRLVYHAYDLFERMHDWSETLQAQEDWLLARADLCIGSSDSIAKRLTQRSGREVRTLPNGADVPAFEKASQDEFIPAALAAIPSPRIGYVGNINRKVDIGLIADLAERRPDWQFVLVGPTGSMDDITAEGLRRCRGLANVHELGSRNTACIPLYVANFDVALMPYRIGEGLWTSDIYPLKLHEYLAADRPSVSTRLASLESFSHVLTFASGTDQWDSAIADALENGGKGAGRRVSLAREYDWAAISRTLASWMAQVCNKSD